MGIGKKFKEYFYYAYGIGKAPERPKRAYTYKTFKLQNQDTDYCNKFAKEHEDELDENDDYRLSKKTLLEDFSGCVFKYDPTGFDCQIKGNEVYDEDGYMVGEIRSGEVQFIGNYVSAEIILYGGKYKYVDYDEINSGDLDHYFELECKYKNEQ